MIAPSILVAVSALTGSHAHLPTAESTSQHISVEVISSTDLFKEREAYSVAMAAVEEMGNSEIQATGHTPTIQQNLNLDAALDAALWSEGTKPSTSQIATRNQLSTQEKLKLFKLAAGLPVENLADIELEHPELTDAFRPSEITVKYQTQSADAIQGEDCKRYTGDVEHKNSFMLHYRWRHVFEVCSDGRSVKRVQVRYANAHYSARDWYDRGTVHDYLGTLGRYDVVSHYKGRMEQCLLKWGCIFEGNPGIKIKAKANGTADFSDFSIT